MRSLALHVALVIMLVALVACGGGNKKGLLSGGLTAPTESAPAATSTPSRGTTPSAASTTTLRTPTPGNVNRENWQAAMLDDSKSLPGEYVSPHPGADARVCDTRACVDSFDDRNHVTGTIPICMQAQLTARNYSNPLCYNSNPPTSGPHANTFAQNRVYDEAVPKEQLVHAMEHAAVIIWYNSTDQNVIRTLAQITNGANQSRKFVVMTKYEGMEANTVALTAWTRLDKFPVSQFRDQRVLDFINAHSRRFNPEGF